MTLTLEETTANSLSNVMMTIWEDANCIANQVSVTPVNGVYTINDVPASKTYYVKFTVPENLSSAALSAISGTMSVELDLE